MSDWTKNLECWVEASCILEVSAEKPGNVSPSRSFSNGSVDDFVRSAKVIAPILARAGQAGVGETILEAVTATRDAVGHNTNLGIILLLTPLCAVPADRSLSDGITDVLAALTVADAKLAYRAIALAAPGGLGNSMSQDVASQPTVNLLECMRLASERDLIAAQYANSYHDVLTLGLPLLLQTATWTQQKELRLPWLAVRLMARFGDSLIRRKCGAEIHSKVQNMAAAVVAANWPNEGHRQNLYDDLDQFLSDAEHKRNPGTTADMIAAILFSAMRQRQCDRALNGELVFL